MIGPPSAALYHALVGNKMRSHPNSPDLLKSGRALPGVLARAVQSTWLVVLWLALVLPVAAQIPGFESSKSSPPALQEQVADPLGRSTPRGTIIGFVRAVQRNDLVSAASFLQLTGTQRTNSEKLALDLNQLMDRYFSIPVAHISDSPEGALDDGLAHDRERVGPLAIGDKKFDIVLVRVVDPDAGAIWLISSDTLAQASVLRRSIEKTWLERVMPAPLLNETVLGISLAQLIAWAASIAIPLLLLLSLSHIAIVLARKLIENPTRRWRVDSWHASVRWPAILVLTIAMHFALLPFLGFSLGVRIVYWRIGVAAAVAALAWLARRLSKLIFERARSSMWNRERTSARSLVLLGERVFNVLIILVAIFLILAIAGVDTTTALAGLGIGGVAFAFGAQKTVENFLGGVFLLSDKALAVGDTCCISNRVGIIEDITLRSVRLRTLEQTLLSIPAGALSQAGIENFSSRTKILAQTTLRLRYGTSVEQLRSVLQGIRTLLASHSELETESSRVRLVDFSARAIELELFAYVLTSDVAKFLSVREELLLQIAAIVEASGSGFDQPTQVIYREEKAAADGRMPDSAAREEVQLPQAKDDIPAGNAAVSKGAKLAR